MARIGTIDFSGISGHKYTFNVYPIKNDFKKNKGAVYVEASMDGGLKILLAAQTLCKAVANLDLSCWTCLMQ